jgi:hypothetical protein
VGALPRTTAAQPWINWVTGDELSQATARASLTNRNYGEKFPRHRPGRALLLGGKRFRFPP